MNWIKQNKKLATILGVMVAGGIGLGTMLFIFPGPIFREQMEKWSSLDRDAAKLENSKFTPNAENVALLAQKLEEYREKFNDAADGSAPPKLQEVVTPITETEFQAKLKERTRAVTQKAGKMTELPKDFALSFDEYTGSLPPNPDVAAELNVQLDVTEKLVNTLLEAGVKSIDSLERTRLPTERGGTATAKPATAPAALDATKTQRPASALIPQGRAGGGPLSDQDHFHLRQRPAAKRDEQFGQPGEDS